MGHHYVSKIKGSDKINIAIFDIESNKWVNAYALGFYDGKRYKVFKGRTCIHEFLNYVLRARYRGFNIYAHNGGKFDFNFLLDVLRFTNHEFKIIAQGGRIIQLKVIPAQHQVTNFVDSVALLPYSLDNLTKDFDVEHKKLNFMDKPTEQNDYEYLYELYNNNDRKFDSYLLNDCYGLYEVLDKFYNIIKDRQGQVGLTLASTALKTYKRNYLETRLRMADKTVNDEIRLAYSGGRTEIFRQLADDNENDKYYWFDINSLYPYQMVTNSYPVSKPSLVRNPPKKIFLEVGGITQCKVEAPKNLYVPVLPYRGKKLYFPVGKFEGYWDNVLLRKAYELGYKIEPIKAYTFVYDKIFNDYIETFYDMKRKAKSGTAPYVISKLLMNSLYGKFAQRQESREIVKINTAELQEKYKDKVVNIIDLDHSIYEVESESVGTHFIPQISIHVTACAQLQLYKYLEMIVEKGYRIFYCDTDSIATDYKHLPCSDKLGDWKREETFIKGYFLLPKTYWIKLHENYYHKRDDGTYKKAKLSAKGYINEFREQMHERTFRNALIHHDYKLFEMETKEAKPLPFKSSFNRNNKFVSIAKQKKSIKSLYDKRRILKDFNTLPFNVKELDK